MSAGLKAGRWDDRVPLVGARVRYCCNKLIKLEDDMQDEVDGAISFPRAATSAKKKKKVKQLFPPSSPHYTSCRDVQLVAAVNFILPRVRT